MLAKRLQSKQNETGGPLWPQFMLAVTISTGVTTASQIAEPFSWGKKRLWEQMDWLQMSGGKAIGISYVIQKSVGLTAETKTQ